MRRMPDVECGVYYIYGDTLCNTVVCIMLLYSSYALDDYANHLWLWIGSY